MPTCFTFVWQVLYVYAKDGDLSFHLLCGMAARDADVALMRRMGICPRGEVKKLFSDFDERTVLVAWPPQERLPRLQWSGWDAVYTCGWHALAALPSVAAAVHSLRRLKLYYWPASEPPAAVAEVLGTHPIERLHIELEGMQQEDTAPILGAWVGAWLARPCAKALIWRVACVGWEEHIARGLAANEGLRELVIENFANRKGARVSPLFLALQGHARLEDVHIRANCVCEEHLWIRLADMPSLRRCRLQYLRAVDCEAILELENLPALESLRVIGCDLVEVHASP